MRGAALHSTCDPAQGLHVLRVRFRIQAARAAQPLQLQNRLLWLCAGLLVAPASSLLWAKTAMQASALGLAGAPLVAGLLLLAAGLVAAAAAARRLRFFFGRGRPASLAPEIPLGATGGSPAADAIKEILRQGGLTYPEPQAPSKACSTTGRRR